MADFIHSCHELYIWRDRLARPKMRKTLLQQILSSDRGSGRAIHLLSSSAL
ncbi:hypothetical protein [Fischerella sp. JS2]|uniref:hypothetical protein n=1 Tax=Fischerella sp. JS2 TaxID=2597771 RepID=UPI0028E6C859|nr:hypothetical protein [Fischerella sp. JS2]